MNASTIADNYPWNPVCFFAPFEHRKVQQHLRYAQWTLNVQGQAVVSGKWQVFSLLVFIVFYHHASRLSRIRTVRLETRSQTRSFRLEK